MNEMKRPERGSTVFVVNGDHWLGGIVNGFTHDGRMLVGVKGHYSGASIVLTDMEEYLRHWCYPGDIDMKSLESEVLLIRLPPS